MTIRRTSDFKSCDYAVGRSYLAMYPDGCGGSGVFTSPRGYARVFKSITPRHQSSFIVFIHAGRSYSRSWNAAWGDKTLARLAREFIAEVVGA